jgi:hypothetical protein
MLTNTSIPWTATILGSTTYSLQGVSASTTKLELSSSIYSLYSYIEWSFMANPSFMESGLLSIGTTIEFTFQPEGDDPIILDYGILSIVNGPGGNAQTLGQLYTLVLVTEWYFDQFIDSHCYQGNCSTIVKQMFDTDFKGNFDMYYGEMKDTNESLTSIRYRTHMSQGNFIESRIREAIAGQNNCSAYIYTNLHNKFEMVDFLLIDTLQHYTAIDPSNPDLASYSNQITDSNKSKYMIYMMGLVPKFNTSKDHQLWQLVNPGSMWLYRNTLGTVKHPIDYPPLIPMVNPPKNKLFAAINNSKDLKSISKIYIEESAEHYDDINSKIINKYTKDLHSEQYIDVICYPNLNLDIGRICDLHILKSSGSNSPGEGINPTSKSSIFNQEYLIESISHVFVGIKATTHMTLSITKMSYDNINEIGNYLDLNTLIS